ncbi:MAG: methyltransferase domain-containing protein [Candidatus Omnitrophica bacterium]|nr:methyltransferase domain-containing protein [Candidatus Omnitrophota bacterium]
MAFNDFMFLALPNEDGDVVMDAVITEKLEEKKDLVRGKAEFLAYLLTIFASSNGSNQDILDCFNSDLESDALSGINKEIEKKLVEYDKRNRLQLVVVFKGGRRFLISRGGSEGYSAKELDPVTEYCVLVVGDDQAITTEIVNELSPQVQGIKFIIEPQLREAAEQINQRQIDLIILDCQMQDEKYDGLKLGSLVNLTEKQIPVILLVKELDDSGMKAILKNPVTGQIVNIWQKPINFAQAASSLKKCLKIESELVIQEDHGEGVGAAYANKGPFRENPSGRQSGFWQSAARIVALVFGIFLRWRFRLPIESPWRTEQKDPTETSDKKYISEVLGELVGQIINRYAPDALNILEEGSGTGFFASILPDGLSEKWTQLEWNEGYVETARSSGMQRIYMGSSYELPFEDDKFDLVIGFCWFDTLRDYSRAIGEIKRVLKRGGKFIHVMYCNPALEDLAYQYQKQRLSVTDGDAMEQFERLFASALGNEGFSFEFSDVSAEKSVSRKIVEARLNDGKAPYEVIGQMGESQYAGFNYKTGRVEFAGAKTDEEQIVQKATLRVMVAEDMQKDTRLVDGQAVLTGGLCDGAREATSRAEEDKAIIRKMYDDPAINMIRVALVPLLDDSSIDWLCSQVINKYNREEIATYLIALAQILAPLVKDKRSCELFHHCLLAFLMCNDPARIIALAIPFAQTLVDLRDPEVPIMSILMDCSSFQGFTAERAKLWQEKFENIPEINRQRRRMERIVRNAQNNGDFLDRIMLVCASTYRSDGKYEYRLGSGFVAGVVNGYYIIITNTHVVEREEDGILLYARDSRQIKRRLLGIASVVLRNERMLEGSDSQNKEDRDIAILAMSKEEAGGVSIESIPIELDAQEGELVALLCGYTKRIITGLHCRVINHEKAEIMGISRRKVFSDHGDSGSPHLVLKAGEYRAVAVASNLPDMGEPFDSVSIRAMLSAFKEGGSGYSIVSGDVRKVEAGRCFLEGLLSSKDAR